MMRLEYNLSTDGDLTIILEIEESDKGVVSTEQYNLALLSWTKLVENMLHEPHTFAVAPSAFTAPAPPPPPAPSVAAEPI